MRRFLPLLLLLAGCSGTLEPLLSAPDSKAFDESLKKHGPIGSWEVSTIQQEARSKDLRRARNAVALLTLSREPDAEKALEKLGITTTDPTIWAIATSSRLVKEELDLGALPKSLERPDMVREGLKSGNPKVYKTAFTLAHRLKLPELQAEIPKALHSKDTEMQALAVSALSPAQARQRLGELQDRLQDADYSTFPMMSIALIETRDAKAWDLVARTAINHPQRLGFLNRVNFHMTPALYAFLVDRAARSDKFASDAYDLLVSQVVQETYPCDRFLMSLTLPRLKAAAGTGKRDQDPEILITILARGSNPSKLRPDWDQLIHGQAAVDFAEKWLNAHRK